MENATAFLGSVARDGTIITHLHRANPKHVNATAIMIATVACDGDIVEVGSAFAADASAARFGSVAADGGAADADRAVAIDAAAIRSSGVVRYAAARDVQRAFIVDAAAKLASGVARDDAARDGQRAVVLDGAAVAIVGAFTFYLVGAVARDGASADGQLAACFDVDAAALAGPAAGNLAAGAAVGDGQLAAVSDVDDLPAVVGSRHLALQHVAVQVEGHGYAVVDAQSAALGSSGDVFAELYCLAVLNSIEQVGLRLDDGLSPKSLRHSEQRSEDGDCCFLHFDV